MWSKVNEKIIDGTSGLSPNSGPIAIVVGTSTKGTLGKAISLGKKSDVASDLGYGTLSSRILDMQKTMADVSILAIPTEQTDAGTFSEIKKIGAHQITTERTPLYTSDLKITVTNSGKIGTAEVKIESTGDKFFEESFIIPKKVVAKLTKDEIVDKTKDEIVDGLIKLDDLGISLQFPIDAIYTSYFPAEPEVPATPLIPATSTTPEISAIPAIPAKPEVLADSWSFSTTAPTSSFAVLETVISQALEMYTPEFVFVAQSVDEDFVKTLGSLSERLFEDHKPVMFLTETDLDPTKSLSDAITDKTEKFAKIDARFVSVVCQPGYVLTSAGKVKRSASGLCAGHITKANVNQSVGATNNFAIYDFELLENWTNANSRALDESRFVTLRNYAGLNNLFWTNGRTLASDKSDYRYIEVVRTVFKAIRLSRRAALPFIQSNGDTIGVQNLLTEVRSAIDTMVTNTPKELDDFAIELPKDQDVANNGVILNIELFGIPIIRTINLNFMFKYNKSN